MHLYGFIIGIAIVIGLNYFEKHNSIIPKKSLLFFEVGIIFSALIGARIYHVVDQWSFYSQNWQLIPQTWNGGLGIFGGLFGALLFVAVFVSRKSYLNLLNSITPILPLCQAIGRLGNFANGENPIWWPEAILDVGVFLVIKRYPKNPTAKYFIGYGIARFLTEFYRHDTWVINSIKIGQVISIIFIVVGILLLNYEKLRFSQKNT